MHKQMWRHLLGPFDDLPAHLCYRILVMLKRKGLKKHHVQLLVNPHLQELDCSYLSGPLNKVSEAALVLELAGERCKGLKRLDVSFSSKLPKRIFRQSFSSFDSLVALDVSNSSMDDVTLSVVGVYGKSLEELNVSYTDVSDTGILTLLYPQDEAGNYDQRFGQCVRLKSLHVAQSHVTVQGAAHALKTLTRQLVNLEHQNSLSAVAKALLECPGTIFKLSSLSSTDPGVQDWEVEEALTACPLLKRLTVSSYHEMNANSLTPLARDEGQLREIHIDDEASHSTVSSAESLLPLMIAQGSILTTLSLGHISVVDVDAFLSLCPQLQHLTLFFNKSYVRQYSSILSPPPAVDGKMKNCGTQLRTLQLRCPVYRLPSSAMEEDSAWPSSKLLHRLLNSPLLKSLHFQSCPNLTDELMVQVLSNGNTFMNLQELSLLACDQITMESLMPILMGKNDLGLIELHVCREITRKDVDAYTSKLRSQGLLARVKIIWS